MNLGKLKDCFPSDDIEWRIQSSGKKGEKIWAMCLAYVTNRAIMNRLDDVCGPENWKNRFAPGPLGGVICGISIKVGDEWVEKWDGADETDIEKIKGGLSGAMKRAGVQWGIGRYLYDLDATFAVIGDKGKFSAKLKDNTWFKWSPPVLPTWALPSGAKANGGRAAEIIPESDETPAPSLDIPALLLGSAETAFAKIESLTHLANHWKKHFKEYEADPEFNKIVAAKDKRKAELAVMGGEDNPDPDWTKPPATAEDKQFLQASILAISTLQSAAELDAWAKQNSAALKASPFREQIRAEFSQVKARFK